MLCSPITPVASSNATGVAAAGKTLATSMTNSGLGANRTPANSNKSNPIANSASALNVNSATTNNNNSMRQQNYELMMQSSESNTKGGNNTLIREIKSRNIGSLSPLCQSIAANLNQQQQQPQHFSANLCTTPPAYITERRQAISMERLNNIHQNASPTSRYLSQIHSQQHHPRVTPAGQFIICNKDNCGPANNSGSLSSGSNSSIDESASDVERQQDPFHLEHCHQLQQKLMARGASATDRSAALARSASRVSRFRSAKEFFERLSSVNGNAASNQHQQFQNQRQDQPSPVVRLLRQSPERPLQARSMNVASRYTNPLAASLTQVTTSVTPIGSTAGSPLKRSAVNLTNHSSSPAINLLPVKSPPTNSQELLITPQAPTPVKLKDPPGNLASDRISGAETSTSDESKLISSDKQAGCTNSITAEAVPRPRSLSLQLGAATASTPPPTPASKQFQLPKANSLSSAYVKLKTTDHSGLSTNTILHINNSQPANKSVISNGCQQPETALLTFCGDNVIVGAGSLLVRRNKQLRIHFEEKSATTFEYLSEEALLDEFEAGSRPDSMALTREPNVCVSNEDSDGDNDGKQEQEHEQDDDCHQHEADQKNCTEIGQRWSTELERQSREHHASNTSAANLAKTKRPNLASVSLTNYRPSTLMSNDTSTIDDNLGVRHLVKPSYQQVSKQEESKKAPNQWSANNGSVIYAQSELVKSHPSVRQTKLAGESQQYGQLKGAERVAQSNPNYQTLRPTKQNTTKSDNIAHSSPANWSNETETTSDLLF